MKEINTAEELAAFIAQQQAPPPKRGETLTAYQRAKLDIELERIALQRERERNKAQQADRRPDVLAIIAAAVSTLPPLCVLLILLLL